MAKIELRLCSLPSLYKQEAITFRGMLYRCRNKDNPAWDRYGGRGIKVLYRDFKEFIEDVGPKPSPKHTLDRTNNDGHYEAGNCRWVTRREQSLNRASTHWVTYHGLRMPLTELLKKTDIADTTFRKRVARGLSVEEAIELPVVDGRFKSGNRRRFSGV